MSIIDDIQGSKISFVRKGVQKSVDISELFDIDENNLTAEFAHQASLYAFFATIQADAERELAHTALEKEQEYASADEYHRRSLEKKEQKYTEAVIRSLVMRDEDYEKAYNAYALAQQEVDILKAIVRALQMRAEMLISLGAQLRQEYSMTGMNVRDNAYKAAIDDAKKALKSKRE
jgi:hypothetical protein